MQSKSIRTIVSIDIQIANVTVCFDNILESQFMNQAWVEKSKAFEPKYKWFRFCAIRKPFSLETHEPELSENKYLCMDSCSYINFILPKLLGLILNLYGSIFVKTARKFYFKRGFLATHCVWYRLALAYRRGCCCLFFFCNLHVNLKTKIDLNCVGW